ncbi:MAG: hypothetical protein SF028_07585 [Candidatus Sumerlaeia bacterium]|nr:hypothetical protein [Candidatus Sumerlaeia bacterium]
MSARNLSEKSQTILRLIADGLSYEQIVAHRAGIRYPDIFAAAKEALELLADRPGHAARLEQIKAQHPQAYAPWTKDADEELALLHSESRSVGEMAEHFGRQPSAIRSRLRKLGLVE